MKNLGGYLLHIGPNKEFSNTSQKAVTDLTAVIKHEKSHISVQHAKLKGKHPTRNTTSRDMIYKESLIQCINKILTPQLINGQRR